MIHLPKRFNRTLSGVVPVEAPTMSAEPGDGRGGRHHIGRGCEPGKSERSIASLTKRGAGCEHANKL